MKTSAIIKQSLLSLVLITLLPMLSVAQKETQTRQTPAFNGVEASGIFKVFLTQNDENLVVVEADQKYIQDIETQVKNQVLHLNYKGKMRNVDSLVVYVSAPEFTEISATGAVVIRSENLLESSSLEVSATGASSLFLDVETEKLTTELSGATSVTFSGTARSHDFSLEGVSVINGFDLETDTTIATIGGASMAKVHATDFLKAEVNGTSSLKYKETPENHELYTSGLGRISGPDGETEVAESDEESVRFRMGNREVIIVGQDGSRDVRFESSDGYTFKGNWGGVELGVNGYMTPDNDLEMEEEYSFLELKYEKSIAVNINMFQQSYNIIGNNLGLVTGLGLGYNNYRFADNVVPVHAPEGIAVEEPNPDYSYRKSKLTVLYLNVPLMLEFQTRGNHYTQRFHIAAGVIAGLRLRSHTKQVYDEGGKKNKDKTYEDFHLRPFKIDATARIGWGRINLFANYSLNSLFREEKGPELTPFTVGIRVLRW